MSALLLGACFALVPIASPPAAAAAPAPPDPFYGAWVDLMSPTPEAARVELDRLAAAGVGTVRQYVFWDRIETSPGVFDWSRTDQMVGDAAAHGITILPTLLYPPAFYSSKPPDSTSNSLFPPSDPETMARFAEAMVSRYGPNGSYWCTALPPPLPPSCRTPYLPIKAWEVWNEPDFPSWWKGHPDATEYLPLLQAVSAGIKRADPGAEVVLGAMTRNAAFQGNFLDQLYQLGAKDAFDTITVNPYARSGAEMVSYVRGVRQIATRNGDAQKPIRVTEYGWATSGNSADFVTTPECGAALLHSVTRRLSALRTELNLESIIEFQWRDVDTTSNAWPHHAGVYYADGTPKPALSGLTEAIAERPAPAGLTLAEACPSDRQAVDAGPHGSIADDSFSRITSGGWGSAETGGAYTLGGTADFSVGDGSGRITLNGTGASAATLDSTSARDIDVRVSASTDKPADSSSSLLFSLVARQIAPGDEYRIRARSDANGAVYLSIIQVVARRETVLGDPVLVPGVTAVPGIPLVLRTSVAGASPTTIKAKVWAIGQPEPSAWALTRTDSTSSLQQAGAVGLRAERSGVSLDPTVTFSFDDLRASAPK